MGYSTRRDHCIKDHTAVLALIQNDRFEFATGNLDRDMIAIKEIDLLFRIRHLDCQTFGGLFFCLVFGDPLVTAFFILTNGQAREFGLWQFLLGRLGRLL